MDTTDAVVSGSTSVFRFRTAVYTAAFLIPALFSAPQWITGTIINALLFISAGRLPKKSLFPVLVLPSLGAVTHGVLFGPQTVFLYYFLPFIWLGNYVLVSVFSATKNQSFPLRVLLSSISKYFVLVLSAQMYFQGGIVPALFVTSMGIIQLITAISGGLIAYVYLYNVLRHERITDSH